MSSYYSITRTYLKQLFIHTQNRINSLLHPHFVEINGVRLIIEKDFSPWVKHLMYQKQYEPTEAKCVIASIGSDDTVLEFGAGLGYISALCAILIGSDRVFACEANPKLIPLIHKTYEINNVSPSLTNAFLGNADGIEKFFLEDSFISSSAIKRSSNAREIEVPKIDVNNEISRIQPTFVIIDVEGVEYELVPYIDLSNVQKVIIELHDWIIGSEKVKEVRSVLTAKGFSVNPQFSTPTVLLLERL